MLEVAFDGWAFFIHLRISIYDCISVAGPAADLIEP